MNPAFEDMFLGPLASPSFSQGLRFRWEDSRRRVRVVFGGITVADSTRVMLLHEFGRLPVFYFPMLETGLPTHYYLPEQDVRIDLLEPTETANRCPYKRKASYWSATIGDQVFKDIAWSYRDPLPACSPISNLLCFFNERADAIYWTTSGNRCPALHGPTIKETQAVFLAQRSSYPIGRA